MTPWIIGFAVVVSAVLQGLLPSVPFLGMAKPPVLLGVVLYFSLMRNPRAAYATAIAAGLLLDLFGQGRIGFSILCLLLITAVVNESRDHLFGRRWSTQMMLGAFGSAVLIVLSYLFQTIDGTLRLSIWSMFAKAYGTMLLGVVTVPLVFKWLDWTDRRLGVRQAKVRQR